MSKNGNPKLRLGFCQCRPHLWFGRWQSVHLITSSLLTISLDVWFSWTATATPLNSLSFFPLTISHLYRCKYRAVPSTPVGGGNQWIYISYCLIIDRFSPSKTIPKRFVLFSSSNQNVECNLNRTRLCRYCVVQYPFQHSLLPLVRWRFDFVSDTRESQGGRNRLKSSWSRLGRGTFESPL